jgi:hypothetical protein
MKPLGEERPLASRLIVQAVSAHRASYVEADTGLEISSVMARTGGNLIKAGTVLAPSEKQFYA